MTISVKSNEDRMKNTQTNSWPAAALGHRDRHLSEPPSNLKQSQCKRINSGWIENLENDCEDTKREEKRK
jgi:hypothetical protein